MIAPIATNHLLSVSTELSATLQELNQTVVTIQDRIEKGIVPSNSWIDQVGKQLTGFVSVAFTYHDRSQNYLIKKIADSVFKLKSDKFFGGEKAFSITKDVVILVVVKYLEAGSRSKALKFFKEVLCFGGA